MLYARGLQSPGYCPTLFDVLAVWFSIYDVDPVTVKQVRIVRQ